MEIRASQSLSENVRLQEEITRLQNKAFDHSYLIIELQAKLEDVVNERTSQLTLQISQGRSKCAELRNRPIVHNEPLFNPELSDNNSPSFTSSISISVGDKSPVNKTPDDNEIEVVNVAQKQISKAMQVEQINQSYVAKATKTLNHPKNRKIDGSEQSSKDGRRAQSYKRFYNDQVTKVNHGSIQNRNSPNGTPILLIGDSIIENIDPRKMSRRTTVKICLPEKKAEQVTAEVKSISVTNPSHVIIHAGTTICRRTVNMNVLNTLKT